jgi:hypothetical protein
MSLTPTIIYTISTGEIKSIGSIGFMDEFREQQVSSALSPWGEDHGLLEGAADPELHYVITFAETPTVMDRPPIPYVIDKTEILADGEDYLTITGLHNPCTIVIDDPDPTVETLVQTVEGGGFEFSADTPGLYIIEISRFPFLPTRIEITAT